MVATSLGNREPGMAIGGDWCLSILEVDVRWEIGSRRCARRLPPHAPAATSRRDVGCESGGRSAAPPPLRLDQGRLSRVDSAQPRVLRYGLGRSRRLGTL